MTTREKFLILRDALVICVAVFALIVLTSTAFR